MLYTSYLFAHDVCHEWSSTLPISYLTASRWIGKVNLLFHFGSRRLTRDHSLSLLCAPLLVIVVRWELSGVLSSFIELLGELWTVLIPLIIVLQ